MFRQSKTREGRDSATSQLTTTAGRVRSLFLSVLLTVATSSTATAQYTEAIAKGRREIAELVGSQIPGATVAVWLRGSSVWSEGIGWADREERQPASTSSRYRIGSISKSLTAAAAGRLLEEGKLKLDEDVRKHVPSFPRKKHVFTLRQLGAHTAGIRHYNGLEFYSNTSYKDVLKPLSVFSADPLLSVPGERYTYTTYGWTLISAAVAAAAKKPFLAYMDEVVIKPLKMFSTTPDHKLDPPKDRVTFYTRRREGRFVFAKKVDLSNKWAGGGYLSTADDIARFAAAHAKAGFHKASTLRTLFTPAQLTNGKQIRYGFGWSSKKLNGRHVVGHTGGSVGGTCLMMLWPEEELVVVVLTNVSDGKLGTLGARISRPFLAQIAKKGALHK